MKYIILSTVLMAAVRAPAAMSGPDEPGSPSAALLKSELRAGNLGFDLTAERLVFGVTVNRATWHAPLAAAAEHGDVVPAHGPYAVYSPSHRATIVSWRQWVGLPPDAQDPGGGGGLEVRPVPAPGSALLAVAGLAAARWMRRRTGKGGAVTGA
jgi:hypothetical protein